MLTVPARRVAVASLLAVVVAGCGSKVSQSNFDKVQTGMTQQQVEGILGTGTEKPGSSVAAMGMSAKTLTWQDGGKTITVAFANDKVLTKTASGL